MTGHRNADLRRGDVALVCFDTHHRTRFDANARDLALLDDIDTARVRGTRVAPRDRIVAHRAAAGLQQAAMDWKARVRGAIEVGNRLRYLVTRK